MDSRQTFVIIGAGNVAFHLGGALANAGYRPIQVIGRSVSAATELASLLNCRFYNFHRRHESKGCLLCGGRK